MLLRLVATSRIEDLRSHSAESVETLRELLRNGARARRDPRRQGFYEVESCSRVFYIHITPRGAVWLLAIWTKESARFDAETREAAAALSRGTKDHPHVDAGSFAPAGLAPDRPCA